MRVLLIHQAFASPDEPGGTRHYELARQCVKHGIHFTIVASDLSYLTGKQIVARKGLIGEQELDGVRVLRAYTYPSLHRSFVWRVVSFLSFMLTSVVAAFKVGRTDVVMGTSPPIFQALSAWFVAAVRRRPFLLEIRDLWPEFAIDMGILKNPILIRLSRWLERFLYAHADHLLVNSPAYVDYLVEKSVAAGKITLIANGVDPQMFDPESQGDGLRIRLNLEGKFVLVYAGAIGPANDLSVLLDAARDLKSDARICFVIVGDGKERKQLQARAEAEYLDNVLFAGARPKNEMPDYLACADACVAILQDIPMFRMTYPNKVFDYMAAGRPILLAIDGVIREVVEAAGAGVFVPPGNAMALANAVRLLVDQSGQRDAMGVRGRAYVEQHFNRAEQSRQFVRLIEKLARANELEEQAKVSAS
jgi:glycosyltransferase involved in cell wall biosynthesis